MKEALGSLAALFQEGLIDPEFYVNDNDKAKEALVNGKCGAMYGYHAGSCGRCRMWWMRIRKRTGGPMHCL